MLLFGGVNLKSYCEGCSIYEFCIEDKIVSSGYEDSQIRIRTIVEKERENQSVLEAKMR